MLVEFKFMSQEGLNNPVANESAEYNVTQTLHHLRHLHPLPRSLHLQRIHRFSLPPTLFSGLVSFDGITMRWYNGIMG